MSEVDQSASLLPDVLRRDVMLLDADPIPHSTSWHRVRAELERLTRENAELRAASLGPRMEQIEAHAEANRARERAESELTALKARIAEAVVVPYFHSYEEEISGRAVRTSSGDLYGHRVALLDMGKEG